MTNKLKEFINYQACSIKALIVIHYILLNNHIFLIKFSNLNISCGPQKKLSQRDVKTDVIMGKNIFTILHSKDMFI